MANPDNPYAIPNPDYGTGIFRRAISLTNSPGQCVGLLEDCSHGFEVHLQHDNENITAIHGIAHRFPLTTCPGATEPLQALTGVSIQAGPRKIHELVDATVNCTHLFDLAVLAVNHAARQSGQRRYDVEVPDEIDGKQHARVFRDGKLVHHWDIRHSEIAAPETLAGNTLYRGFSAWANAAFSGDDREAAFVLQKGFFVSQARRFADEGTEGMSVKDFGMPTGVCHSYSDQHVGRARLTANRMRDFTHSPEQVLRFL